MKKITTILVILILFASVYSISCAAEYLNDDYAMSSAFTVRTGAVSLERLYIQTYPEKTVYKAFERLNTEGLAVRAVYTDGTEATLSLDKLTITYKRDDCLRVGDDGITLSYGGKSVFLPITVERIAYDMSAFAVENFSVEYNGRSQSYQNALPSIVGLDGIPLVVKVIGGGVNAGTYSVTLDFSTDSRDYLTPESMAVTMTVLPAKRDIIWSDLSFVYDGKSKVPTAYYEDVNGIKVFPSVYGAATEAGDSYIATASINDANYIFNNTTEKFEIKKADYDFSSVIWSEGEFVYDGTQKRVYLSGLPDGVSIVGYRNDRQRFAGSYTATATISYDERNYNPPPELSYTWQILPAEYDMSAVSFLPTEAIYDGFIHYPKIEGNIPTGADGIRLEYSFSSGAVNVSDGEIAVTITFSTKSKNYVAPSPIITTVKIIPRPIYVSWSGARLYYTGDKVCPDATSPECKIIVEGGEVNVGKYIATAKAENSNFTVENKDFEYEILKTTNEWTLYPSGKICYESRDPEGFGTAKFGEVKYRFFTDPECRNEIDPPRIPGNYYAIGEVGETENYYGISSEPFSFTVVAVVATGLNIDITKIPLRVFDRLSTSDFSAYISYNDGTRKLLESSLVKVGYSNGEHILLNDKQLSFFYDSFSCDVDITVSLALYDLSNIKWQNIDPIYDGSAKSPILLGLPEGVKVISYIGANVTGAGSYTVSALVEYDEENYEKPLIPDCNFTIQKCILPPPSLTATYNGTSQSVASDSELYSIVGAPHFRDAGKYAVTVSLTDPDNYEFADGNSEGSASFEILPIPIYISIPNVSLHLWDTLGDVEYTHTGGQMLSGDRLQLEQYIDGDTVKVRSVDMNYKVIQSGGEITRLPFPSAEGIARLSLYLLIICLVAFCFITAYVNRHKIKNAVGILHCKWHNRNFCVNTPKVTRYTVFEQNRFATDNSQPEPPQEPREEKTSYSRIEYDKTSEKNENAYEDLAEIQNDVEEKEPPNNDEEKIAQEESPIPTNQNDEAEKSIDTDVTEIPIPDGFGVDAERADELITDSLAKNLVRKEGDVIYTDGTSKGIINVDTLNQHFSSGDRIDINSLKQKSLIPYDTAYIKVLARGIIDKPLTVYANDFSLSAVKMIALTGGEAIKSVTMKQRNKNQ